VGGYSSPALVNSLLYANGAELHISPIDAASLAQAKKTHQPVYSLPIIQASTDVDGQVQEKTASLQLLIPAGTPDDFRGMLVAEYSVDGLLRYGLPNETRAKYLVALFSAKGDFLTGALPNKTEKKSLLTWAQRRVLKQSMALEPIGDGLILRAQSMAVRQGSVSDLLLWLVGGLSLLSAYMLFVNWRHTRLRAKAQQALQHEIAFRRAMENSMPVGMRALDLEGKVTYVNPAFCKITGWDEEELINQLPPYPYWPEGVEESANEGRPSVFDDYGAADVQYRLQRKKGNYFDARIHSMPLLNEWGQQTGWMSSMTDVTEATKIRQQLSQAHDRFTAVLEAFVGAVSVISLQDQQLLFLNKNYRDWFGQTAAGHLLLARQQKNLRGNARFARTGEAEQEEDAAEFEYFVAPQNRWLGVRTRTMTWTDGKPAQLLIANDISPRKEAEAVAAAHTERAMASSHLITMGEMASSVAHELNQPLTAINNYCNGMISRIDQGQIADVHDLVVPLQKTAKQAERAAQIILRIRAFVKRSAPNRALAHPADLVHEAYELFDLELRKRQAQFELQLAPDLPQLSLDPILIEQVLVNLVKNAAEAMDMADIDEAARRIVLAVDWCDARSMVCFSVQDSGKGLAPEVERHLFDAFYSTKKEGMGIGLNLCRSIIEAHGGKLIAQNLYNETDMAAMGEVLGCRFSFTLPVQSS
jgi:PAS domain S-box-containing protein